MISGPASAEYLYFVVETLRLYKAGLILVVDHSGSLREGFAAVRKKCIDR